MICTICNKRLTRKTARQVDGVVQCSACLFGQTAVGDRSPQGRDSLPGSVGDESAGPEGNRPNPLIGKGEVVQADEIERVARALWCVNGKASIWDGEEGPQWSAYVGERRPKYLAMARAAIAALHDHRLTAQPVTVASPGYEAGLAEGRREVEQQIVTWLQEQELLARDFPGVVGEADIVKDIIAAIERRNYRPTTEGEDGDV